MSLQPKQIEPEEVGRFSIDKDNNLYWDGQRVQTQSVLRFSQLQRRLAIAVSVFAILGSLATIANATASWMNYLKGTRAATLDQSKHVTPASTTALPLK